jgi:O-antigen ligase
VGWVVLLQLLENYFSGRVFIDGSLKRELLATGWGMHNNIGIMMAMTMPFGFYLAGGKKCGWLFNLLGTALLVGTVLTCSRTSIMMAGLAYLVCGVLLLKNPQSRRNNWWVYLLAVLGALAVLVIFGKQIWAVFELFFSQIGNVSQRDKLISFGFRRFLEDPVFGGSFYPQGEYIPWDWADLDSFSSFFPPRWHNTIIQILASCGIVGFAAYSYHRLQTLWLFLHRFKGKKMFVFVSMVTLLATSMVDCHFFNVGPVLFYSMMLAFVEKRLD